MAVEVDVRQLEARRRVIGVPHQDRLQLGQALAPLTVEVQGRLHRRVGPWHEEDRCQQDEDDEVEDPSDAHAHSICSAVPPGKREGAGRGQKPRLGKNATVGIAQTAMKPRRNRMAPQVLHRLSDFSGPGQFATAVRAVSLIFLFSRLTTLTPASDARRTERRRNQK
jgi:hypothetical protein